MDSIHPVLEKHIPEFIAANLFLFKNKTPSIIKYSSIRMDYDRDGEETGAFVTAGHSKEAYEEYMFTAYTGLSDKPSIRIRVPFSKALKYLPYSIKKSDLIALVKLTSQFLYDSVFVMNFKGGVLDDVVYTQAVNRNQEKTFVLYKNNNNLFKDKFDYYMYSFLDNEGIFSDIISGATLNERFVEFMSKKKDYLTLIDMNNI